jgi:hypothetical protein
MNPKAVLKEVKNITMELVRIGLADEFSMPVLNNNNVYWSRCNDISISMRNIPYKEIYKKIISDKNFNFKFPDGGVIQLLYQFDDEKLIKHRLAFFPSPDFEEFQNNPEIYDNDEIYGDVVDKQVMPVIVRIDYNKSEVESEIHHPYCHLTLGQYKNCRIPVDKPVSPKQFVAFILENFYYTPTRNFLEYDFKSYITESETHIYEEDLLKIHLKIT